MDERVIFYTTAVGEAVYITRSGDVVYCFREADEPGTNAPSNPEEDKAWRWSCMANHRAGKPIRMLALKEVFAGGKAGAVRGTEPAVTRVSCFKGQDPAGWRTDIPTFHCVSLGEVYDGIEVRLRSGGRNVEKVFHVRPGARVEQIRIELQGAESLAVTLQGELAIRTGMGTITCTRPVAFQETAGRNEYVDVMYTVNGLEYGFLVGDYDRGRALVIDPSFASTYVGDAISKSMALDDDGNVFLTGETIIGAYPTTPGAYDTTHNGDVDIVISKLDSDLTTLLASTFVGGSNGDRPEDIVLDETGNVLVDGCTGSADFPTTPGAFDETFNGNADAFALKMDGNLSNLKASTYLGGDHLDGCESMALDGDGNIYISGVSWWESMGFPTTPGAYEENHYMSWDVFIAKFDPDLTTLHACTLYAGEGIDRAGCLAVDESGSVFISGHTKSEDLPVTPGAYDETYNGASDTKDVYVARFSGDLTTLEAATYLGGSANDWAECLILDGAGGLYLTGSTESSSFPTTAGAYNETYNGGLRDAFVSRFSAGLRELLASTFIGGSTQNDYSCDMALNDEGMIFITGHTHSWDYPTTPWAYDESYNGGYGDCFISRLNGDLTQLEASTYLGGSIDESDIEQSRSIALSADAVYVLGETPSPDFPTSQGAFDETHSGVGLNIFVVRMDQMLSAKKTVDSDLTCAPPLGILPFQCFMAVTLTNEYPLQARRAFAHVDFDLAGGQHWDNWKTGTINLPAGGEFFISWNQILPVFGSLVGQNVFTLSAEDVTPPPFNQLPYPPSGDTDLDTCMVVGVAP